jgi:tRNA modification GTPase
MDTIFAPITATISGAIITIRISGDKATNVIDFFAIKLKNLTPRYAHLQELKYQEKLIDQVLMTYFPAPNSYTGEDVIEISIHASKVIYRKITNLLLQIPGFRYAEAGEFSKRAFLNQKIDLLQAEAIDDLIKSNTEIQADQALKQLYGINSNKFLDWKSKLIKIQSYFEVFIDFPDEDIPQEKIAEAKKLVSSLTLEIKGYLNNNNVAEIIREGIKVTIIGPTNSGKSSLINNLSGRDIAITSDIAGTTRDVIDVHLDLAGYPVILTDTAGLRSTNDTIEKIGIQKAKEQARNADLVILLVPVTELDLLKDYSEFLDSNNIIVANKADLLNAKEQKILQEKYPYINFIAVKYNQNVDNLIKVITNFITDKYQDNNSLITRQRHRDLMNNISEKLQKINFLDDLEILAEDLRAIISCFSQIVGHIDIEEVLDDIFYNFCIGK